MVSAMLFLYYKLQLRTYLSITFASPEWGIWVLEWQTTFTDLNIAQGVLVSFVAL
ncbi:hypothetical protein B0O99DRAFT_644035, partial [Bisporella sp. PMI_857]